MSLISSIIGNEVKSKSIHKNDQSKLMGNRFSSVYPEENAVEDKKICFWLQFKVNGTDISKCSNCVRLWWEVLTSVPEWTT